MKKGTLKILICALFILLFGAVLTACNPNSDIANYDYRVTFDYNEGNLLETPLKDQFIGVMANNLVSIRPGYKDFREEAITAHYIEGWYLPQTGEDGSVLTDETTKRVLLGRKWDFEKDRVNEDITLYANFQKSPALSFVDIATDEVVSTQYEKPGFQKTQPSGVTREDYTFLGKFYADKSRTEFQWPYVYEAGKDTVVYVEFLKGNWTLVSDETSFVGAINTGSANIYLMKNLDFTGKTLWTAGTYKGEIDGNGHSVTVNQTRILNITRNNVNTFNTKAGGIFGELASSAYVHDITFKNVSLGISVPESLESQMISSEKYTGLLAATAAEGARIKNVVISGKICADTLGGSVTVSSWIGNDGTKAEDVSGNDALGVSVLDGAVWAMVTTPEEFRSAIENNKSILLQNDIDFGAALQRLWYNNVKYGGEIDGGGHTVKAGGSVVRTVSVTGETKDNTFGGLFGVLKATANIHDIKFEGIDVKFTVANGVSFENKPFGMMATVAEQGAKISNVVISGNIYLNDKFTVNPWIADDSTNAADVFGNDFSGVKTVAAQNN